MSALVRPAELEDLTGLTELMYDYIVGFATLYFTFSTMKADKIAVMNDLFVIEPFRDSELESRLYMTCKNYCIDQGFANMTWITSINNTRAQSFFKKMNAIQGKDWVHFSIN
ncbi:GNAT family N-acetyltransferase [Paenibacillus sp. SN-8-1]|uniref:GNAT family N-acetyltransferase n=1 Tax=Paenibacillus sp. SN-8-1 TaxID=3435409 RepID=UPI003D9A1AC8